MTDTNDGVQLDLPKELVLRIFEEGARAHTELAHSLCLVSRWTCILALPKLYDTVLLKTLQQQFALRKVIENSIIIPVTREDKGDEVEGGDLSPLHKRFTLKDLVKSIWLEPVSKNRTLDIFRLCDGLVHIALPLVNLLWLVDSSSVDIMHPRELDREAFANKQNLQLLIGAGDSEFTIGSWRWTLRNYVETYSPERRSPLFSKISHIRLAGLEDLGSPTPPGLISHFTNLSHLAIPCRYTGELVQDSSVNTDSTTAPSINPTLGAILNHPPLTHLVLIKYSDVKLSSPEGQSIMLEAFRSLRPSYPKLFFITMEFKHLQRDWELEVGGGNTFWEKVEEFTASLELTL